MDAALTCLMSMWTLKDLFVVHDDYTPLWVLMILAAVGYRELYFLKSKWCSIQSFFLFFSHAVLCTQALMLLGYFPSCYRKKKSIIILICLFVLVIIRVKIRNKHSRWINMVNTELICTDRSTGILDEKHSSH